MTTTKKTTTKTTRTRKKDTVLEEPLVEDVVVEEILAKPEPVKEKPVEKPTRIKIVVEPATIGALFMALNQIANILGLKAGLDPFLTMKRLGKHFGLESWKPGQGAEHTKKYIMQIVEKYNAD